MIMKRRRAPSASAKRGERPAQKRRTRKAIVDAAIALMARGTTPSVNDVATAADVSRRTVYLYFPSFDQLLLDATIGALSQTTIDRAIETTGDSAEARVERLVRAMQHVTPEVERLGRTLVRLTLDAPPPAADSDPRRGYRRIEWIESALAPWRERLDPEAWRRLVCALALIVGWEALLVQRDVCGLSLDQGEEISVWAARTLVRGALRERV